jgi:hypothetical protein
MVECGDQLARIAHDLHQQATTDTCDAASGLTAVSSPYPPSFAEHKKTARIRTSRHSVDTHLRCSVQK